MSTLYLPTGPRGAGKSTLTKAVLKKYPHVKLVSRDDIMEKIIDTLCFDRKSEADMTEAYVLTESKLTEELEVLFKAEGDNQIILDCYTLFPLIRRGLVTVAKRLGIDRIVCWNLVTPLETSIVWYDKREGLSNLSETERENELTRYIHDYKKYHELAESIPTDGFDVIHTLDLSSFLDITEIM